MKKIIHISDFHVGYKDFGQRFFIVINNLIREISGEASDYVLIVTGDFVDNAHNPDSIGVIMKGLEKLKSTGFRHILMIPGNHDYGNGKMGNKKFVKMFQKAFYGWEYEYPKKDIIGQIAYLGLDSMAEELNWNDRISAEGEFGKDQLNRLEKMLELSDVKECKKRVIYFHHHPFDWRPFRYLKDSGKLKKILISSMKKGVSIDALLFGHNHQGRSYNGRWNIARCYDAGTATLKPRPKLVQMLPWFKIAAATRIIDIYNEDANSDSILSLFQD